MVWYVWVIIVAALAGLTVGFLFLFDVLKFKDEKGEKKPLPAKGKWLVGVLMVIGAVFIPFILVVALNPPFWKKWCERWNSNRLASAK